MCGLSCWQVLCAGVVIRCFCSMFADVWRFMRIVWFSFCSSIGQSIISGPCAAGFICVAGSVLSSGQEMSRKFYTWVYVHSNHCVISWFSTPGASWSSYMPIRKVLRFRCVHCIFLSEKRVLFILNNVVWRSRIILNRCCFTFTL